MQHLIICDIFISFWPWIDYFLILFSNLSIYHNLDVRCEPFLSHLLHLTSVLLLHSSSISEMCALQVPDCQYKDFSEQPPLISTCDTQRVRDLLNPWISRSEPFVLVGPEGSGKGLLLQTMFKSVYFILHLILLFSINKKHSIYLIHIPTCNWSFNLTTVKHDTNSLIPTLNPGSWAVLVSR